MIIEYHKNVLDDDIIDLLDIEFRKYAMENGVKSDYRFYNFIAKEKNDIIGILRAHSNYDEVIVDDLIVFQKYRNVGVGTALLTHLEKYFKGKGFRYISLMTHEFQAPKFYEKCGFQLEFKRENKENPKLTRYYFVKYF